MLTKPTPDTHAIAGFLRRIDQIGQPGKPACPAVHDAFFTECIETGGFYPDTMCVHLSYVFEMQLYGIKTVGETESIALARWIGKARAHIAMQPTTHAAKSGADLVEDDGFVTVHPRISQSVA